MTVRYYRVNPKEKFSKFPDGPRQKSLKSNDDQYQNFDFSDYFKLKIQLWSRNGWKVKVTNSKLVLIKGVISC